MRTAYAAVGAFDKAFASLERAYQERSAGLLYLKLDPDMDRCEKILATTSWSSESAHLSHSPR